MANAANLQLTDLVNIVIRMLQAAHAAGMQCELLMPDRGGIRALLERHLRRGNRGLPALERLDFAPVSTVEDTFTAARLLLRAGVSAIAVVGGDGIYRAVVSELCGMAAAPPIAGLSIGTNNAFPELREPTFTGLATGLFAAGRVSATDALADNKLIEVQIHGGNGLPRRDVAIVDAVITHDRREGARALWKSNSMAATYLAFAEPEAIGLSSIGGLLQLVGRREPGGLALQLADDDAHALTVVHAPIAPAIVLPVRIAQWQRMVADESLTVAQSAGTVALDGERELAFETGQRLTVTLRENDFSTLDVARCMAVAARDGLLRTYPQPRTT